MKIEKINENQIKFILSQADLEKRNLSITELSYGSEKMQELFRDMMEQAMLECGFYTEQNSPLMIEAVTLSTETIMIIVTKIPQQAPVDERTNITPSAKDERKYKIVPPFQNVSNAPPTGKTRQEGVVTFLFNTLEDVIDASERVYPSFMGESELYKDKNGYHLLLYKKEVETTNVRVLSLLNEYAVRQDAGIIYKFYLNEHGEAIIKNNAINTLASLNH